MGPNVGPSRTPDHSLQACERRLPISATAVCVNHKARPSVGCDQEENLAITISLARSMNRFWPWTPMANSICGSASTVYQPLR